MTRPTTENEVLEKLQSIERMVQACLRTTFGIDVEGIAVDVWIETTYGGSELSWTHVRNRCIDVIRAVTRHGEQGLCDRDFTANDDRRIEREQEVRRDARELLDKVMAEVELNEVEARLLVLQFYAGKGTLETATAMGMAPRMVVETTTAVIKRLQTAARQKGYDYE